MHASGFGVNGFVSQRGLEASRNSWEVFTGRPGSAGPDLSSGRSRTMRGVDRIRDEVAQGWARLRQSLADTGQVLVRIRTNPAGMGPTSVESRPKWTQKDYLSLAGIAQTCSTSSQVWPRCAPNRSTSPRSWSNPGLLEPADVPRDPAGSRLHHRQPDRVRAPGAC